MNHKSIFEAFKIKLPTYADAAELWVPHDKYHIRVRLINKQVYVFGFKIDKEWVFETLKHHNERMKKK